LLCGVERIDVTAEISTTLGRKLSSDSAQLLTNSLAALDLGRTIKREGPTLQTVLQVVDTACGLFRATATTRLDARLTFVAAKRYLIPLASQYQRLWNLVSTILDCSPPENAALSHVIDHYFQALQDLLTYSSRRQWPESGRRILNVLWTDSLRHLIEKFSTTSFTALENHILAVFDITVEISRNAHGLADVVYETVQPLLKTIEGVQIMQPTLCGKIQVAHLLFSTITSNISNSPHF
jgi:hypothetical protein